jgi:hypothetical protein
MGMNFLSIGLSSASLLLFSTRCSTACLNSEQPSEIPTIDVSDASEVLQPFLQYLYPRSLPKISDLPMWEALYTIANKYSAEMVMELLKDMLIHRFLDKSPVRVYALASHWGFEEIAKIASTRTLTMNIFKDVEREDAELMGGGACQRLYLLHFNRRKAARAVITFRALPSASCGCPKPNYSGMVRALDRLMGTRPWLTAEELYEGVASSKFVYPKACSDGLECRNAFTNVHKYFSSILEGISKLPQTI